MPLSFRAIEESQSRVGEKRVECAAGVVLDAVSDDEQLDGDVLLRERAPYGVRKERRVPVRRDEDRRVGGQVARLLRAADRANCGGAVGDARPRRIPSRHVVDERTKLGEKRQLASRVDGFALSVRPLDEDVLVPATFENGEPVVAVELHPSLDPSRAFRDLRDVPTPTRLEDRMQRDESVGVPDFRGGNRPWHLAEHLERDGEVVWGEHPARVLLVAVVRLDADRAQTSRMSEPSCLCDLAELADRRVIPPLVHHKQAVGRESRETLGVAEVVAERLLDEDRHAELEGIQDDVGVRRDRRDDDDRIDAAQAFDLRHDRSRAAFRRSGDAGLGSCDDVNVASERAKVAQNVSSPVPAADLPDDHGRR